MKWENLVEENILQLVELRNLKPLEIERNLAIYFVEKSDDLQLNLKAGALCDTFYNIFKFVNSEGLDDLAFIICFKVILRLLVNCKNGLCKEDNLKAFKAILCELVLDEGDKNQMAKLDNTCTKKILDYILVSFFQHYELYEYLFTEEQDVVEEKQQITLEVVPVLQPFPPPLEESISEELFNLYINPSQETSCEADETDVLTSQEGSNKDIELDASQVDVDNDTAEYLMSNINKDEMRTIIAETAMKRLTEVKVEFEKKISEKESLLVKQVSR